MEGIEFNDDIIQAKVCPYCMSNTEYVDSSVIYKRSFGMVYLCRPCDAFVGVHGNTKKALGRLANKDLRIWKKNAHSCFDFIWKKKMQSTKCNKRSARSKAYGWLSKQLGTPPKYTHIGMFDIDQCKRVVEVCKPFIRT